MESLPRPSQLIELYTADLVWSLFLTSTALHAIALITSPVQAVYKWHRRGSSDSDTSIPYVCAVVGSVLWLRYSVFIGDTKLVLLQSYAVTMQTVFLFALIHYRSRKRRLARGVIAGVVCVSVLFLVMQQMVEEDGRQLAGRLASGAQIAGSLVCPYLIYRAVSTGFIDFIPMAPVAFTWVMEAHAIVYSVAIDDYYMMLANTTFFCMDGSLLACFFLLPTERPADQSSQQHKEDIALL